QLRQHRQLDFLAKTTSLSHLLPQQQRIEESLDLPRVAFGTAGQNRTDLIAQDQRVVCLVGILSKRCTYGRGVQRCALPRSLQSCSRRLDQFAISGIFLTQLGPCQKKGDVDASLRLAQRRNAKRDLDQLL